MNPDEKSGSGPESPPRTSEESGRGYNEFQGDVEAIPDDNISQSGQLMTVGRALRDVPDYLKPWAACEQPRRPRLKDACFANHPGRTRSMSFAEARAAAAGTPGPGSPSAAAASTSVPRPAAMSASVSAPVAWNAPGAPPGGAGIGERRRSNLSSVRENQRAAAAVRGEALESHNTDWAEPAQRRMQNAAVAGPAVGRPNGQNGQLHRILSPFSAPQRRSNHGQRDGVELSSRSRHRRTGNVSSTSDSSNHSSHGGSSRGHHSRRGSQPRSARSSGGGSRSGRGRADSLGTPVTLRTSGGMTRDTSGRGGNDQVVDSERENPGGDVETVGEGHTEELQGGDSDQHRTLEDALSSIPQPLRRAMHS